MGMKSMPMAWLRFFRIVNIPTAPGDVLVGAAAVAAACGPQFRLPLVDVALAGGASVFLYMFGLADNDIVGAKTDTDRPIPRGEISLRAACATRASCAVLAIACAAFASFRTLAAAVLCALVAVAYNRTKSCVLMGLCRGMNVLLGSAAVLTVPFLDAPLALWTILAAVAIVWTLYIAGVTRYSEGEECDIARKRRVGVLVGAIVYLQLAVLVAFALARPVTMPLLVVGAVLLALLRLSKTAFRGVSAS